MRFVRLARPDGPRLARLGSDGSIALAPPGTRLGGVLADSAADPSEGWEVAGVLDLQSTELLPAIDPDAVVVNIGSNYHDHALPAQDAPRPELTWFIKSPTSWTGHRAAIGVPQGHPDMVDYEGEICIVFGAPCYRVPPQLAWSYIGGYTLMNDVSGRDAWPALNAATTPGEERAAWNAMVLGKQHPTFGPIGPVVVTADEIVDPQALVLRTLLNGEEVQRAAVHAMKIGIAELISRLSQYFAFRPGDVISTGTPGGVGQSRGRFLQRGDEVSVDVPGIGTLTNPVR
ncbi:5-carboxymethyl-2-hydroxymuconate isomerase [Epidermidibacterium keratini]|uniref:5-carboxymethyl-2-hydroxymuconate isomerase n=1 Tax=Epidermidibacterium keratini TaxID=1891644 RepID=A0A7L4YMX4_9ACTN|nr:fumarylacetoacetate hydrolase family protein [Epidermidibacterium keratini]QHC00500.1 5-carboxymethyl-2-hydroxymuconate isomerase [Epidermidibacterium keratini]